MSEEQAKYKTVTEQDTDDAREMLGSGYMEIHPPSKIISGIVGQNGLQEHKTQTWIKLSTSFRAVMARLKGSRLSVFLCISLHINENNNCYPSLETIARETGYSRREVINAVHELEQDGFLTVIREGKKSNLYHVDLAAAIGAENSPVHFARVVNFEAKNMLKNAPKEEPIKGEKRLGANAPDPLDGFLAFERLKHEYAEREGLAPDVLASIEAFPADCQNGARLMFEKCNLTPPEKPRSGKGGDYADWINGIRDIVKLCAEYKVAMVDGFDEFYRTWNQSPFTYDRPGSMLKTMRSALAVRATREKSSEPTPPTEEKHKPVPRPAGLQRPNIVKPNLRPARFTDSR